MNKNLVHFQNLILRELKTNNNSRGCDKFCSFCVVPYTRGNEYSRSVEEIYAEAKNLVENGALEINLLAKM